MDVDGQFGAASLAPRTTRQASRRRPPDGLRNTWQVLVLCKRRLAHPRVLDNATVSHGGSNPM